ncbi:MAG: hypothetical protein IJ723_03335 [Ruminococcus sp.]|nr:hypothetical protein [Ruminococcus sp.]
MDNENKAPVEEKNKKPADKAEKPETEAQEQPAPDDGQADENGEGAAAEPEQAEQPAEETPAEEQTAEETAPDATAELEQLRAENARLKAQLEAHNAGFRGEYIEDAVLIAENAANRDGITITEALQAVAKKYPEWKHTADDKGRNGFKVGAETPKEDDTAEDDKLNEAFGIRKK